jgi:hypothetical protein
VGKFYHLFGGGLCGDEDVYEAAYCIPPHAQNFLKTISSCSSCTTCLIQQLKESKEGWENFATSLFRILEKASLSPPPCLIPCGEEHVQTLNPRIPCGEEHVQTLNPRIPCGEEHVQTLSHKP